MPVQSFNDRASATPVRANDQESIPGSTDHFPIVFNRATDARGDDRLNPPNTSQAASDGTAVEHLSESG
jgi:hypothetical protein